MGIAVDNSGCAYVIATTYDSDFWPHSFVAKITTGNNPPTANAGPDQTVHIGNSATLDGSASSDPDGDAPTYSWSVAFGRGRTTVILAYPLG